MRLPAHFTNARTHACPLLLFAQSSRDALAVACCRLHEFPSHALSIAPRRARKARSARGLAMMRGRSREATLWVPVLRAAEAGRAAAASGPTATPAAPAGAASALPPPETAAPAPDAASTAAMLAARALVAPVEAMLAALRLGAAAAAPGGAEAASSKRCRSPAVCCTARCGASSRESTVLVIRASQASEPGAMRRSVASWPAPTMTARERSSSERTPCHVLDRSG
mmetsp:Transcript_22275/g.84502  ORF Transcript_22275/g.84502 Transcript_22275/m.84502 type:complete len:226 (-) Transcript_22275:1439-2116(-)